MHGRKKREEGPTPEETAALATKIAKYKALEGVVFKNKRDGACDVKALVANAKLLGANPDVYSAWNHRREMLADFIPTLEGEALAKAWEAELALTVTALERNPKSYGAWHQRRYIVTQCKASLERELALCSKFLDLDQRNFHCWAYRQWVAKEASTSPAAELEYTTAKINQNFSNYSAWHYRTVLLPKVATGPETYIAELELVQPAIFTEPDDQSAWMYHRWIMQQLAPHLDADGVRGALEQELEQCLELWGEEDKCKWPLAAAVYIKGVLGFAPADISKDYDALVALDPAHRRYYEYAQAQQAASA